jgi:hypothetical protein
MIDSASPLTAFQIEVARLFFGLPASDGFLLAGGPSKGPGDRQPGLGLWSRPRRCSNCQPSERPRI